MNRDYLSVLHFCDVNDVWVKDEDINNPEVLQILNGTIEKYKLIPKYYKYIALYLMFDGFKGWYCKSTIKNYLDMAINFGDTTAHYYMAIFMDRIEQNIDKTMEAYVKAGRFGFSHTYPLLAHILDEFAPFGGLEQL